MVRITKYLGIIERSTLQYRTNAFKKYNLSGSNQIYIYYLRNNEGVTADKLALELHINKSNVARSLKVLEETDFIYRKIDNDDRRSYKIYLTKKAIEAFPFVYEKNTYWNDFLLEDFSEEEKEFIRNSLEKIANKASSFKIIGEDNEKNI